VRYTISGHNAFGGVTSSRYTAVEAVEKAVEMMGQGMQDVHIIDTKTGRIYRSNDFQLVLQDE
jgi:hypothetical protein